MGIVCVEGSYLMSDMADLVLLHFSVCPATDNTTALSHRARREYWKLSTARPDLLPSS